MINSNIKTIKDYNTELYTSKKDALNSIHHELIAIQNKLAEKGYISTMSHIESGEYEVRITTNDYKVKYLYNIGDGDIKFVNMVIRNYKAHLKTIPEIVNVIFNEPATIVLWSDGSKTVVKADGELFDPEKGLAMAIVKKMYGNKGNYFNNIKKWTDTYNRDGNAMSPCEILTLINNKYGCDDPFDDLEK